MRLVLLALLLCALAAAPARADGCAWAVISNCTPPETIHEADSGKSYPSSWTWQYLLYADHFIISGNMNANAYRCTTNLSSAATGNGTLTVVRLVACRAPVEDIEAVARNEFKARAMIDDDSFSQAYGSQRIKASKIPLDCHACGGVESTSSGHGSGNSGTFTIQAYPGGPSMVIHWSKGGVIEKAFQASDGGTGGRTPEVFACQTNLSLSVSVGWWNDAGEARIKDSKSELTVWGTCDGYCGAVTPLIESSIGY
jgi:hypothetical protein